MPNDALPTPEERARHRAQYMIGLLYHVGIFVIVNAFLWMLDLFVGESGAQWAYWVTGSWGLGLLIHALAWFVDGRDLENRLTERYLHHSH